MPLLGQAPARGQPRGHLGRRLPLRQPLRPHDVGAEVEVAEGEPLRHSAVGRELALDPRRLVGPAPALLLVDAAAEGVEQRVDVGADPQPEEADVVAGVGDDGELGFRCHDVEMGSQAPEEAGSADAAREGCDSHAGQSVAHRRVAPTRRSREERCPVLISELRLDGWG